MKNKDKNYFSNNYMINDIINIYYKEIFNYCYLKLNYKKQDAEECTQETFTILLIKWRSLSNTNNIRAWLYRTADNIIRNYNRKTKRYKNELYFSDDAESSKDLRYDNDHGVFEILSGLSIEEQQLLKEYYLDRSTARELAKKYKISENAMFVRIHRIKTKAKKIIGETLFT